jgi:hypothetical protein
VAPEDEPKRNGVPAGSSRICEDGSQAGVDGLGRDGSQTGVREEGSQTGVRKEVSWASVCEGSQGGVAEDGPAIGTMCFLRGIGSNKPRPKGTKVLFGGRR